MAILSRSLALWACLALLGTVGCSRDLGLDDNSFSCASDDDCIAGQLCGHEQTCVPAHEADAAPPDPTDTEAPDTAEPDTGEPDTGEPDIPGVPDVGPETVEPDVEVLGCTIKEVEYDAGQANPENPCEICDPEKSEVLWAPVSGIGCEDGDPCTENGACNDGVCESQAVVCEPGAECTTATCSSEAGCVDEVKAGYCLIGESCYDQGAPKEDDPCQSCDPDQSIDDWSDVDSLPPDQVVSCDDEDPCTTGDQCVSGTCEGGLLFSCDDEDQNPCTLESCEPDTDGQAACVTSYAQDEIACGEQPDQGTASCIAGACITTCDEGFADCDGDPSTGCEAALQVNPATCGSCENQCPDDDACNEGLCSSECPVGKEKCAGTCVDINADTDHCGVCDQVCDPGNTQQLATCEGGVCALGVCPADTWDHNADPKDGCEVFCALDGDEATDCDGKDNDCDGETDEDFDLLGDVSSCGGCGIICAEAGAPNNADPGVDAWDCEFGACQVSACEEHHHDLNKDSSDGCESTCEPKAGGVEVCGFDVDEDCDGLIDEGQICPSGELGQLGSCQEGGCGFVDCEPDTWDADGVMDNGCEYACAFDQDQDGCDGVDNDCDGQKDEDGDEAGEPCPPGDLEVVQIEGLKGLNTDFWCARRQDGSVWCWGYSHYGVVNGGLGSATLSEPNHIPLDGLAVDLAVQGDGKQACALLADGTIQCWGYADPGLIPADLSVPGSYQPPIRVEDPEGDGAPLDGIKAIYGGHKKFCALRDGGAWSASEGELSPGDTLWCWGLNNSSYSPMGPGTGEEPEGYWPPGPVRASLGGPPLEGVIDACIGTNHGCAILSGEGEETTTWCWGHGSSLANVSGETSSEPTQALSMFSVPLDMVDIECGNATHTCGLRSDGLVLCWGSNNYGQLGNAESGNPLPFGVVVYTDTQALQGDDLSLFVNRSGTSCAVDGDGKLFCWGRNYADMYRTDAIGSSVDSLVAREVEGLGEVAGFMTSTESHCAWLQDGTTRCWGYNTYHQLGRGGEHAVAGSVTIPLLMDPFFEEAITGITLAGEAVCALGASGVRCWGGYGSYLATTNGQWYPSAIPGDPVLWGSGAPVHATAVSLLQPYLKSEEQAACAILDDGKAACWGYGGSGVLGNGSSASSTVAKYVTESAGVPLADVVALEGADREFCAISGPEQEVSCWGTGTNEIVADGVSSPTTNAHPQPVPRLEEDGFLTGATSLAVSGTYSNITPHGCAALEPDGEVWCWGNDDDGQLGDGEPGGKREEAAPVILYQDPSLPEARLQGVHKVATASATSCAITEEEGQLYCWGSDDDGTAANGALPEAAAAQKSVGQIGYIDIAAGFRHFVALHESGSLLFWGDGNNYVFGNGLTGDKTTPTPLAVDPAMIPGFSAIFAGAWKTCGLDSTGALWCWGKNTMATLGQGTYFSDDPQPVVGLDLPIPEGDQ